MTEADFADFLKHVMDRTPPPSKHRVTHDINEDGVVLISVDDQFRAWVGRRTANHYCEECRAGAFPHSFDTVCR